MSEKLEEVLLNFADAMENAALILKQSIGKELKTPQIKEAPFLVLKYEQRTGNKLKEFEVATKTLNSSSADFDRCLNILMRNKATIQDRFKDQGWNHSYWVYQEAIYRQTLKK